jgi:hypothetical protein
MGGFQCERNTSNAGLSLQDIRFKKSICNVIFLSYHHIITLFVFVFKRFNVSLKSIYSNVKSFLCSKTTENFEKMKKKSQKLFARKSKNG